MRADRRSILILLMGSGLLNACGAAARVLPGDEPVRSDFVDVDFADWSSAEPPYLLYPGDEIDVRVPAAPELNQSLRVGPDGRIALPLIGQVMAADRSLEELGADIEGAYRGIVRRPAAEVVLRQAAPLRVWVDGQVAQPGVYEMIGDTDAYQAIIQAGGFRPGARRGEVVLIRRGPGGRRMMRTLDLSGSDAEQVALRRSDIVFVPRTGLGELAAFMTQVRDSLPIGFSYSLNDPYQP